MLKYLFCIRLRTVSVKMWNVAMLVVCLSCSAERSEAVKVAQRKMEQCKELYAIALQTGEVVLPLGGKYLHVVHPGAGGWETPLPNLWLVNGGYLGEIYECQGCDSCMSCYRDAGLITYEVKNRDSLSVQAFVELTDKGRKYLIENHIHGFFPIIGAWRRRENIEILLVAKEKFNIVAHFVSSGIYNCKAYRSLEMTPFLEALGGTEKDASTDYVRNLRVDYANAAYPVVTFLEIER